MEGLTANGGLELEVSASQLSESFPLLLERHIRLVTSDLTALEGLWAFVVVAITMGLLWEYLTALTWVGRAVLVGALVVFGVVDSFLIPRPRTRTLLTMGIAAAELGGMVLLALLVARLRL